MKTDFYFHESRFVIFNNMTFLNQRRLKAIKLNYENCPSLLHRRFRRCKVIIYYSLKNVNDIK